jgi:hypothetical protein
MGNSGAAASVAGKPNDLAGKRRGFRSWEWEIRGRRRPWPANLTISPASGEDSGAGNGKFGGGGVRGQQT